jgi:hypothetical protein
MADVGKPAMPVVFAKAAGTVERLCFGETVFLKRLPKEG